MNIGSSVGRTLIPKNERKTMTDSEDIVKAFETKCLTIMVESVLVAVKRMKRF